MKTWEFQMKTSKQTSTFEDFWNLSWKLFEAFEKTFEASQQFLNFLQLKIHRKFLNAIFS